MRRMLVLVSLVGCSTSPSGQGDGAPQGGAPPRSEEPSSNDATTGGVPNGGTGGTPAAEGTGGNETMGGADGTGGAATGGEPSCETHLVPDCFHTTPTGMFDDDACTRPLLSAPVGSFEVGTIACRQQYVAAENGYLRLEVAEAWHIVEGPIDPHAIYRVAPGASCELYSQQYSDLPESVREGLLAQLEGLYWRAESVAVEQGYRKVETCD